MAEQGRPESLVEVDAAFVTGPCARKDQYVDPISLGALIVSVATLAWQIYTDLVQRCPFPAGATSACSLRVRASAAAEAA